MIIRFSLLAIVIFATLTSAEEPNWPGFRGEGNSHTLFTNLPTKWSDTENIAWRTKLIGSGQSSPVIANQTLYLTSTGGDQKQHLYIEAFGLADGSQKWKAEFSATQKPEKVTDMISRGTPTPVADANGVYAFFESGDLFALNHKGESIWERRIVTEFGEFKGTHGIGTSLVNTPDDLILSIDHDGPSYLICISKETGETKWKTDRSSRISWSTPTYHSGQLFISSNGTVDCYDLSTGKQKWSIPNLKGNTVASPTVGEDQVYIGSSNPGDCLAIKIPENDQPAAIAWRAEGVTSSFGSPLLHGDKVYYVNRAGVLQSVRVKDGSLVWQHRLPSSSWASPLSSGNQLYFFGKDGKSAILTPGESAPENMLINELAVAEKDRIYGYAISSGRIYLRTESEIICVGNDH